MATFRFDPDHPYADESGMVEVNEDYYLHKAMTTPDVRMMNGNEPVTLHYINDNLDYVRHMANGKIYTSKKKFRDETKARGCIEVGNETKHVLKPRKGNFKGLSKKERVEDIKKTIYQLTGKA